MEKKKQRIGIVGFGHLGQFIVNAILKDPEISKGFELAFIWNRSIERVICDDRLKEFVLSDLNDFPSRKPDLIIEVSHPTIVAEYGEKFLEHADFLVGSPTAFSNPEVESKLRKAASHSRFGCYIPSGALWGAEDIRKMALRGQLTSLVITMKKHPSSLKLETSLMKKLAQYMDDASNTEPFLVYEGSVRTLCPLAPHNVNTMACAALAAVNLGFDRVQARLIADKNLEAHIIEIDLEGSPYTDLHSTTTSLPHTMESANAPKFRVSTTRYNPAQTGSVTGLATYDSFLSSLISWTHIGNRKGGFHFC